MNAMQLLARAEQAGRTTAAPRAASRGRPARETAHVVSLPALITMPLSDSGP